MSIEVMKRLVAAVEAIPEDVEGWMPDALTDALIDAKKAIAEAEKQEPVACQHKRYLIDVHEQTGTCYDCGAEGRMRFVVDDTRPQPKSEPLTDEQIEDLYFDGFSISKLKDFARALDAKLKEKNT